MKELPHKVLKSQLAMLAWLINRAIDNGNYELSIEEVRKAADNDAVFQLVKETLPTHRLLDLSMFKADEIEEVNRWFGSLNGNFDGHVEKSGLCLLMAWTIEMMQHAPDIEDLGY